MTRDRTRRCQLSGSLRSAPLRITLVHRGQRRLPRRAIACLGRQRKGIVPGAASSWTVRRSAYRSPGAVSAARCDPARRPPFRPSTAASFSAARNPSDPAAGSRPRLPLHAPRPTPPPPRRAHAGGQGALARPLAGLPRQAEAPRQVATRRLRPREDRENGYDGQGAEGGGGWESARGDKLRREKQGTRETLNRGAAL